MIISGLRYQINTLISNRDDRCTREGKLVDKSIYSNISMSRGLDNYLVDRAERMRKEIGGLESVDEHVAVLGGVSDRDGEIILLYALAHPKNGAAEFNRMYIACVRAVLPTLP